MKDIKTGPSDIRRIPRYVKKGDNNPNAKIPYVGMEETLQKWLKSYSWRHVHNFSANNIFGRVPIIHCIGTICEIGDDYIDIIPNDAGKAYLSSLPQPVALINSFANVKKDYIEVKKINSIIICDMSQAECSGETTSGDLTPNKIEA